MFLSSSGATDKCTASFVPFMYRKLSPVMRLVLSLL